MTGRRTHSEVSAAENLHQVRNLVATPGPEFCQLVWLRVQINHVDSRPNPHGIVFPAPTGVPWYSSNYDRRIWEKARDAAGIPWATFHSLRRFWVSRVRAAGLPTSITEQLVGHTDDATHRLYTRPIPGTEGLILDGLSRAFSTELAE